jgi:lipoprotein-anchoring transpeptidase ErfK/SrfK
MRVRKLVIGAAIAATAVLSACSSQPTNVGLAGAQVNTTTTVNTPSSTTSPTATTPSSSSTVTTPSSSKTEPKTTTPKPTTPKPTTSKPAPPPAPPKPEQSTEAPCSTAAKACIKLSTNQTWLMENGKVVYGPVPITSGRPGHLTPPGTFRVQFKDIDHKSKEFDDAPMPYSVFFNGGIAFHQGSLSVKSHGCIHLSLAAAKQYFNSLSVGEVVEVVR